MSEIESLSTRFWDLYLEASPSIATLLGDHRFDHELEDLSQEFFDESAEQLHGVISDTEALDGSAFDRQDRITQAMLISEASNALTMLDTRVMVASPDPLSGPAGGLLMYAGQTAAQDATQAGALYERYRMVPRLLAQALDLHKAEVAAGRTPIAANIQRVLSQVDDYLSSPIETDPFANLAGPDGWNGLDSGTPTCVLTTILRPASHISGRRRSSRRKHVMRITRFCVTSRRRLDLRQWSSSSRLFRTRRRNCMTLGSRRQRGSTPTSSVRSANGPSARPISP